MEDLELEPKARKIRELQSEGVRPSEIARQVNCPRQYVYQVTHKRAPLGMAPVIEQYGAISDQLRRIEAKLDRLLKLDDASVRETIRASLGLKPKKKEKEKFRKKRDTSVADLIARFREPKATP